MAFLPSHKAVGVVVAFVSVSEEGAKSQMEKAVGVLMTLSLAGIFFFTLTRESCVYHYHLSFLWYAELMEHFVGSGCKMFTRNVDLGAANSMNSQ